METCFVCSKPIVTKAVGRPKKFCSDKCKSKDKLLNQVKECNFCKKVITGTTSQYCSTECRKAYNKVNRKTYMQVCQVCCKMFETRMPHANVCSTKCRT